MRTAVKFLLLGSTLLIACGPGQSLETAAPSTSETAPPPETPVEPTAGAEAYACESRIPVYETGQRQAEVCPAEARDRGLTVLNLSPEWTPSIFSETPEEGEQPYRSTYLELADQRVRRRPQIGERFLELYGIFPTFRVLRERVADEDRHACHAAIEDGVLDEVDGTIRAWGAAVETQRRRVRTVTYLRNRLSRAKERLGLSDLSELATHEDYGRLYAQYEEERKPVEAVTKMQAHLRCDGLLRGRNRPGIFDWRSAAGLREFQQMHMVVSPGLLDEGTREALRVDSREADFRAVLRALRERVISATGLLEDGSASREWQEVLGRRLDPREFHADVGHPALEDGAPDLISPATEAAAFALGWTDPETIGERLAMAEGLVAVRLPPVPNYHGQHMALRAVIDRGDVYYAYPYAEDGSPRGGRVDRRPVLTLYADTDQGEVALVRWSTTIGGWKSELDAEGNVGLRYKESPAGPRIWRDVIASPAWLPPPATPDDDLIRNGRPDYGLFGPGYRSAYGLTMVMHHKVIPTDDEPRFADEGIRAHGSVSYRSILRGTSHGCHRLYNHLAVRLSSFLVDHRNHVRHGAIPANFARTMVHEGEEMSFRIRSRGYRFELTPPVEVEVLEGRIRGPVSRPPQGFRRLREELVADALAATAD